MLGVLVGEGVGLGGADLGEFGCWGGEAHACAGEVGDSDFGGVLGAVDAFGVDADIVP